MKRNVFLEEKLKILLDHCSFFDRAICYDVLDSTNDTAKELASLGAPEGTVVLAEHQTQGRGRMGRCFFSPKHHGLYMSLVLRPSSTTFDPGLLTACAAVAVYQALLELFHLSVSIKWVNDLYVGEKKLCGILAEGHVSPKQSETYVVMGIGLNLTSPTEGYPEELKGKVTSVCEAMGSIESLDVTKVCASIIRNWGELYLRMPDIAFLDTYRSASCVLGKNISYCKDGKRFIGTALSIDDDARLVIQSELGEKIVLSSGEVNFVRPVL